MKRIENAKILENKKISENAFHLKFYSPKIAKSAIPGQFIHIKVSDLHIPLWRRPFSVCRADKRAGIVEIMFDIRGEGTKILSGKKNGDELDIVGPLGKGFNTNGKYKTAILVAGGIGVPPIIFLNDRLNINKIVFIGARNKKTLYGVKELKEKKCKVLTSTDDGNVGYKGFITDLVEDYLKSKERNIKIFACGPNAMLRTLTRIAKNYNVECEVSLESVMSCATGICQGCPIRGMDKPYKLVCIEGPVFNSNEIILE
jgi:dihydroorotate dehydrogenase electron transfer subunit